ncbi:hypothetical protein OUZ56_017142 [Daphnia magna]|uniref:Uncharacterized protein n=1 Tax=Daphnia magna TaxID=35525 RepID=A0ABR0AS96_9CRUS|nr:hypothetical protein OUZ56_017142 [Daphnia magna]
MKLKPSSEHDVKNDGYEKFTRHIVRKMACFDSDVFRKHSSAESYLLQQTEIPINIKICFWDSLNSVKVSTDYLNSNEVHFGVKESKSAFQYTSQLLFISQNFSMRTHRSSWFPGCFALSNSGQNSSLNTSMISLGKLSTRQMDPTPPVVENQAHT